MASKSDKEKKVTGKAPADSDKVSAKKESSRPKKRKMMMTMSLMTK
jgi:hypothetical protein